MPRARAQSNRAAPTRARARKNQPVRETVSLSNLPEDMEMENSITPRVLDPVTELLTDTLYKVQCGSTLLEPFVEKLSHAYSGFDGSKRQIFQNALVMHVRRCFIFMIELNRSKKSGAFKRDESVDRIITFVINVMRALTTVELDKENAPANTTVIETESVITTVLKGLLNTIDCKHGVVRMLSAEMIGQILSNLADEAEVMNFLFEEMTERMLERAQDRSVEVRCAALKGLNRLQDYKNPEDEIIQLYLAVMATDENEQCRKIATSVCGLNRTTLLQILDRCQDVSPVVRVAAYTRIAQKVRLTVLKHSQVLSLIERGLADANPEVVSVLTDSLIPAWLSHVKNKNKEQGGIADFMAMLDPTTSLSTSTKCIQCILKRWSEPTEQMRHYLAPEQNLVTDNMLPNVDDDYYDASAVVFTWFNLYQYIFQKDAELVKDFLPGLPPYCDLLISKVRKLEKLDQTNFVEDPDEMARQEEAIELERMDTVFVVNWLLKGIQFFEAEDPASRAKLVELAETILCGVSSDTFLTLSENLHHLLKAISRSERKSNTSILKEWIEVLREGAQNNTQTTSAVTDISTHDEEDVPIEIQIQLEDFKMRLAGVEDDIEIAVASNDAESVTQLMTKKKTLQQEFDDLKKSKQKQKNVEVQPEEEAEGREEGFTQDSATKALILLIEYLKKQRKTFERGLEEYIRILVLPVLPGVLADKSETMPLLEESAIKCLGLFACFDKDVAKEYLQILVLLAENETNHVLTSTQEVAVNSLTDFALIYQSDLTKEMTFNAQVSHGDNSSMSCIAERGLQTTVANILIELAKSDRPTGVREAALGGIARLLISGRSAPALIVVLVLYILDCEENKEECQKFKRVIHLVVLGGTVIEVLDEAFKNTVKVVLHGDEGRNLEKAIDFYARLCNPDNLKKVFAGQKKMGELEKKNLLENVTVLPFKILNVLLELLKAYPDHIYALTMCRLLHNFNLRPAFQKPFEEPDSALGVQCKEILFESERLIEECRNVIRDRRMAKELEVFRVIIEDQCRNVRLLDERRNAEKGKRLEKEKRRSKGKGNKRTKPENSQSESSQEEEPTNDDSQ